MLGYYKNGVSVEVQARCGRIQVSTLGNSGRCKFAIFGTDLADYRGTIL
jgi:hypothetical protein